MLIKVLLWKTFVIKSHVNMFWRFKIQLLSKITKGLEKGSFQLSFALYNGKIIILFWNFHHPWVWIVTCWCGSVEAIFCCRLPGSSNRKNFNMNKLSFFIYNQSFLPNAEIFTVKIWSKNHAKKPSLYWILCYQNE